MGIFRKLKKTKYLTDSCCTRFNPILLHYAFPVFRLVSEDFFREFGNRENFREFFGNFSVIFLINLLIMM